MSLTAEQEAALRANTTTGDPFDVHSASVAAWRNVWALLDAARAQLAQADANAAESLAAWERGETERVELRKQLATAEQERAHWESRGDAHLLEAVCAQVDLAASQAENVRLREALNATNLLMVRPAHVFSCGAYNKFTPGGVCGECTCGVDAAAKRNADLLSTPPGSLDALREWSSKVAKESVLDLERNDWLKPDAMHAITEREVVPVIVGRLLSEGGQP